MKLNYIGRKTIGRYGCYGCHDIPNFETARPIGTTLQDWGRKDTSRLAPEHIEEYLEEHKEANGISMHERIVAAMKAARAGGTETGEFKGDEQKTEMRAAYYYNDLLHHGRAGFLWQKLRDPRSYDYLKTETKGYDERLRMPKFPFNEEDIEAIETFVLGLVADPPAKEYLYRPEGAAKARIEGERMLDRYNCGGCHMLQLPEIKYAVDPKELAATQITPSDHPAGIELLAQAQAARKRRNGPHAKGEDRSGREGTAGDRLPRPDLQPARSGRRSGRTRIHLRLVGHSRRRRQEDPAAGANARLRVAARARRDGQRRLQHAAARRHVCRVAGGIVDQAGAGPLDGLADVAAPPVQGGDQGPDAVALPVPPRPVSPAAHDRAADAPVQYEPGRGANAGELFRGGGRTSRSRTNAIPSGSRPICRRRISN